MKQEISKRIFIVGIARSGTTLLQSMIGSHSDIFTMPETHFWDKTLYKQKLLRSFQVIGRQEIDFANSFLGMQSSTVKINYTGNLYSKRKWTELILTAIDELALEKHKKIWLEKTPLNLYYINLISKVASETIFIHIIRNGMDNIASLYEAGNLNPEFFAQSTIDQCINRYVKEINLSKKYLNHKNHFFVTYEELISYPEETLKTLCKRINIEFQDNMLNFKETANRIILSGEEWKSKNRNEISESQKKDEVFSKEQQKYIEYKIKNVSLSDFET